MSSDLLRVPKTKQNKRNETVNGSSSIRCPPSFFSFVPQSLYTQEKVSNSESVHCNLFNKLEWLGVKTSSILPLLLWIRRKKYPINTLSFV